MTNTQLQYSPQVGDPAPELTASSTSGKRRFPLSVDSTASLREISRAYGVRDEHKFYSNRAWFLVDKEGRVRWCHVEANNGQRRENAEILAAIKLLS